MQVAACVGEVAGMAATGLSPPPSHPPNFSPPFPPPAAAEAAEVGENGCSFEGLRGATEASGEDCAPPSESIYSAEGGAWPGGAGESVRSGDLSLEEKRRMVHRISLCPEDALDLLQNWTRRELLQLICAEMGEERKYTGLTKSKMIERLLKLVSQNDPTSPLSPAALSCKVPDKEEVPGGPRKRRKSAHPPQKLPAGGAAPPAEMEPSSLPDGDKSQLRHCPNVACQAVLDAAEALCKRCSCCICHGFDDNKDPSLWLVCSADGCGLSCHLRCALRDERCGIARTDRADWLDGEFFCLSCGKKNGLIGVLRKQLAAAKDARRVDLLCKRVSLSHQMLQGTERLGGVQAIVDSAARRLKEEVGPLDHVSPKMARGVVKRLACGAEVQKLCALAVEAVDGALSAAPEPPPAAAADALPPHAGSPGSAVGLEEEAAAVNGGAARTNSQRGSTSSGDGAPGARKRARKSPKKKRSKKPARRSGDAADDDSVRNAPNGHGLPPPPAAGTGSKCEAPPKASPAAAGEPAERRYEYCVKVIRWLECEGHMEKEFRVKFLTWFSLKATAQERRVVSAFIDVLIDEPASLVDQLVDAFKDGICHGEPNRLRHGAALCTRLWH
ncbi:VIN3-like protein 3 [Wolffia australiana]